MLFETGRAERVVIKPRGDRIGVLHCAVHEEDLVDQPGLKETVHRAWPAFDEQALHLLIAQLVQEPFKIHIAGQVHRGAAVGQHGRVLFDAPTAVEDDAHRFSLVLHATHGQRRVVPEHGL